MKTAIERAVEVWNDLGRVEYGGTYAVHQIKIAIQAAINEEREACAEAAEATCTWVHYDPYETQVDMRTRIAAAIRARSVALQLDQTASDSLEGV